MSTRTATKKRTLALANASAPADVKSDTVEAVKQLLAQREQADATRLIFAGGEAKSASPLRSAADRSFPVFRLGGDRKKKADVRPAVISEREISDIMKDAGRLERSKKWERLARDTDAADPDEAVIERRAKRPRLEDEDDGEDEGTDVVEGPRLGSVTDDDDDDDDDESGASDETDTDPRLVDIGLALPPPLVGRNYTAIDDIRHEKKRLKKAELADSVDAEDFRNRAADALKQSKDKSVAS